MISKATLNELQDDGLRSTKVLIDEILRERDEDRKSKAIIQAKATLAAVGLSFDDLKGRGRGKSAKGPVYQSGQAYQHPADKALVWNGKGKKPGWLLNLEGEGKTPLAVQKPTVTSPNPAARA